MNPAPSAAQQGAAARPSSTTASSSSKFATVLRVTSGNFMEMFDFFLFGFYATQIAKTFFPVR
jgi:MHS family citrate/tricarballylate:H+ symporter-like MFS transporter